MSRLALYYLGPPHITLNTNRVAVRLTKANALLAYLGVAPQPHSRDTLATLLWPETDSEHARTSLRSIVSALNSTLGREWLLTTHTHIALNRDAEVWLDVALFEGSLQACCTHGHEKNETCPRCIPALQEAVALYRGDFLSGFSLADSLAFDEWQLAQSERLRDLQLHALTRLSEHFSAPEHPQLERAIHYARRRVDLDPYIEPAHQRLIQLYLQAGQRVEALRQYQTCVHILEHEFAIPPSPETMALYRQAQEIKPHQALPTDLAVSVQPTGPAQPAPSSAPFVGREAESQAVDFLLRSTNTCRMVTLVGPGGIGKTRLAYEVAQTLQSTFQDGVIAINLESVDHSDFIAATIAEALNLVPEQNAVAQVLAALAPRHSLLLLDNFDHLIHGVALVGDILQRAPRLKLLVTSQEPLHLQGEWLVRVTGLDFPDAQSADDPSDYSAIQLFLHIAQQSNPGFHPTAEDWPWIARICRLVDGMPLGIGLAARWVRLLSCREIALKIEDNLEFLATSLRDIPERHRSIRAVFEHTWALLAATERQAFADMSVFVGGFREEAAQQVADVGLPALLALVDRGLLQRQTSGRYDRHPLLWHFASEKLGAHPVHRAVIQMRHCSYYTAFLKEQLSHVRQTAATTGVAKATLALIEADIQNIRAALHWAVTQQQGSDIAQALEQLYYDYERQGWLRPESDSTQRSITPSG